MHPFWRTHTADPALKPWLHLAGVLGTAYVLFGSHLLILVISWGAILLYAASWWACLDERLEIKRYYDPKIDLAVSPAFPLAVVLLGLGIAAIFVRLSAGIGFVLLGIAILLIGYWASSKRKNKAI